MNTKRVSMMTAIAVLGLVVANAGAGVIWTEGFNTDFGGDAALYTGSSTWAQRFGAVSPNIVSSPDNGLSASEGDAFNGLNTPNNPVSGGAAALGQGSVALETITAAGVTYTFTGDFGWRYDSVAGAASDISLRAGTGFAVIGGAGPSAPDFSFGAFGSGTWNEYTFSYTTVADDIGKDIEFRIVLVDENAVAGTTQLLTDTWRVESIPEPATFGLLGIAGCVITALRRLRV